MFVIYFYILYVFLSGTLAFTPWNVWCTLDSDFGLTGHLQPRLAFMWPKYRMTCLQPHMMLPYMYPIIHKHIYLHV